MAGQVSNGWLIKSSPAVDVDSVDDIVHCPACVRGGQVRRFVLSGGGEEEAPIGSKGQPAEEGCQCFIGVNICILQT